VRGFPLLETIQRISLESQRTCPDAGSLVFKLLLLRGAGCSFRQASPNPRSSELRALPFCLPKEELGDKPDDQADARQSQTTLTGYALPITRSWLSPLGRTLDGVRCSAWVTPCQPGTVAGVGQVLKVRPRQR
jgi:hypothetical protein